MPRWPRSLMIAIPTLWFILASPGCMAADPKPAPNTAQGWTDSTRVSWYTISQGSRLIPKAWMDALEQPYASAPFLEPAYIGTFRYLPNPTEGWPSPDSCPFDRSLPLGFTVDCQSDNNLSTTKLRWKAGQRDKEPWVGLNCSACHTAQMTYQGTKFIADGGPSLADFQSFTEALATAMHLTVSDPAKFGRFAAKVLGPNAAQSDKTMLVTALGHWNAWNDKLDALNNPGGIRYGFGRLDAIGHIFNKVSLIGTPDSIAHQTPNPSDAPTSYPFLWNVPQLDKVEWNGMVSNGELGPLRYGALGRNAGEVVGVYGDIIIKKLPAIPLGGYTSSVDVQALNDIETQLVSLLPPKWPSAFPPIDAKLADSGRTLFAKQCAGCHTVPTRPGDLTEKFTTTLQPVLPTSTTKMPASGTDFWMACNAIADSANSGLYAGNKTNVLFGDPIPASAPNLVLLTNAVTGVLADHKLDIVKMTIFPSTGLPPPGQALFAAGITAKQARAAKCQTLAENANMVYKGRPLQGIWATAPYLHNGSVPNLWELLLPPAQRSASFNMGSREFDPKNVGYVTAPSADNSFVFKARDTTGAPIDGNASIGHDYNNAGLSDADRWALVEYMKTL